MPAAAHAMTGNPGITAERVQREPRAAELAPTLTGDVVRTVAAVAIGVNIALSLIDVWRLVYIPVERSAIVAAALALVAAIPLHIRHVLFGLRGERPPAGGVTLALLAVVNVIALSLVGSAWLFQFASLVVSVLIVVPGAWGLLLAAVVATAPLFVVGLQWHAHHPALAGAYLAFAIVWRSTTQYVPLRLVAAMRALDLAGRELGVRAVVQTRVRIDADLRTGVAAALEQIVGRGDDAAKTASGDPARARAQLTELVHYSRQALSGARRIVAGYRGSSVRTELDAATALLEASGATVEVVAAKGVRLDVPDNNARAEIRTAVARALRDEPNAAYRIDVAHDAAGRITVAVVPGVDDAARSSGKGS